MSREWDLNPRQRPLNGIIKYAVCCYIFYSLFLIEPYHQGPCPLRHWFFTSRSDHPYTPTYDKIQSWKVFCYTIKNPIHLMVKITSVIGLMNKKYKYLVTNNTCSTNWATSNNKLDGRIWTLNPVLSMEYDF